MTHTVYFNFDQIVKFEIHYGLDHMFCFSITNITYFWKYSINTKRKGITFCCNLTPFLPMPQLLHLYTVPLSRLTHGR